MGTKTLVAWTDHTANFWIGCQKVSDGCKNCYAETFAKNRMGLDVWGPAATTDRQRVKSVWQNVPKWNREAVTVPGILGPGQPHLMFSGSMMDWAEDHPTAVEIRPRMWDMIRACRNLHFQLLTKRPERIRQLLPADWGTGWMNVWLGTSIEDMRVAQRADHLRDIPAVVRFISYEPALGPLDQLDITGIDWCIFGGESGLGYRAPAGWQDWARAMREKCREAGVAFFFKQSPAARTEMGTTLDGETVREFPKIRIGV